MKPDIDIIESELQHRLPYVYKWYRKQNDQWDRYSDFIYTTVQWKELIPKISGTISRLRLDKKEFFYYTINRWYNYWSAVAVEFIFGTQPGIIPAKNKKNKLVDFLFFGEEFDHKTSVFPKGFNKSLAYAKEYPKQLLEWLYRNQSQGKRKHLENRMFIIVYSNDGEHWKLKSQISWLRGIISTYVATFDDSKLYKLQLRQDKITKAGLIWAVR
ncbi:hypothetical protein AB832_03505 [Flavobacteriaceae bacterium (ex Bugula neritina AB1)]|nr:hypothetical protein AB832_03505 [Flavobacteriaceae bacterium (ex Bugula neritina AB1)]